MGRLYDFEPVPLQQLSDCWELPKPSWENPQTKWAYGHLWENHPNYTASHLWLPKGLSHLLSNEIPSLYPHIPINPCWLNMGFPLIQSDPSHKWKASQSDVLTPRLRPTAMARAKLPHCRGGFQVPRWSSNGIHVMWPETSKEFLQVVPWKKPSLWVTWEHSQGQAIWVFGCIWFVIHPMMKILTPWRFYPKSLWKWLDWWFPSPKTGRFAQVLTMGKPWQPSDPSLALATPSPSCSFRGARKEFWSTIGAAARTSPKKLEQKRVDHAAWSENVGKNPPNFDGWYWFSPWNCRFFRG